MELVDVDSFDCSCSSSWLLPNAAWEVLAAHLSREDILSARLACRAWSKDLGACVSHATAYPTQLLLPQLSGLSTCCNEATAGTTAAAAGITSSVVGLEEAAEALAAAEVAAEDALQQEIAQNDASSNMPSEAFDCNRGLLQQQLSSVDGVHSLLDAFPHCDMIYVDVSTPDEQQLAGTVINTLAGSSSRACRSSAGGAAACEHNAAGAAAGAAGASSGESSSSSLAVARRASSSCISSEPGCQDSPAAEQQRGEQQHGAAAVLQACKSLPLLCDVVPQQGRRPRLCLDALQRSYHCPANKEYPSSTVAGRGVFRFLAALPSQLSPDGLAALVSVQLDAFPEAPAQWAVLQRLPCLRELLLPSFRPALPHEHLPALARLTQLDTLTVSVQGSITSWRANCASFASLGALSHLARLSLHAFHCPGAHLAAALLRLSGLEELRLSGRVVLEPLAALSRLGRLQVLELTQDVQYDVLCGLVQQLTGLTQLAVGRVTLPPAAPPPPPAAAAGPAAGEEAGQEQQAPAAAAADGAGDMPQLIVADAAPAANAAAGAVMVAADGGGAAAAAAAAAGDGGGVGEVMLEDVGAIVDGLIGNLQEGAVPVHLQRIIERFESIIQLDLTRRQHSTPWGWPVPGLALLQELGSTSGSTAGSTAGGTGGTSSSSSELTRLCAGAASCGGGGAASLELALLRSADVVRLHELPSQLRCCSHLALRLRDQLLAFASVCPLRLAPGQLAGLGAAFQNLSSLSLCGKVALDGRALIELTEGLAGLQKVQGSAAAAAAGGAAAAGCSSGGELGQGVQGAPMEAAAAAARVGVEPASGSSGAGPAVAGPAAVAAAAAASGLVCLSLDCHFVAVSPEQMEEALQHLQGLKVLCVRHRGGGKLPLPLSALPASLTTLALKKVLLYHQHGSSSSMAAAQHPQQQQQLSLTFDDTEAQEPEHVVGCHALTSPGFRRAVARGLSRPPSPTEDDTNSNSQPAAASSAAGSTSHTAAAAGDAANSSSSCGGSLPLLPRLQSLFLKNCLVGGETLQLLLGLQGGSSSSSSSSNGGARPSQLLRLSVTGDQAAHGEVAEAWPEWVAAVGQLTGLQVLDVAVPESTDCALPPDLLQALLALPRLAHLHITTHHAPQQLLGLTALAGRLRTLNINYTGPPTLPSQLLSQLREGLGFNCRVQVWENVVLPSSGSFVEVSGGGGGGAEGLGGVGRRRRGVGALRGVVRAASLGAVVAGGWWCGWVLGSALGGRQRPRRQQRQRKGMASRS
uniref:Uncharacterized protein n=1 Tax=Tetradesmus obliquus TaxID=3088 RepID=A0A383WMA3_TETOB|eukprot:jgi/Sobl393_1/14280/SZX72382.1